MLVLSPSSCGVVALASLALVAAASLVAAAAHRMQVIHEGKTEAVAFLI